MCTTISVPWRVCQAVGVYHHFCFMNSIPGCRCVSSLSVPWRVCHTAGVYHHFCPVKTVSGCRCIPSFPPLEECVLWWLSGGICLLSTMTPTIDYTHYPHHGVWNRNSEAKSPLAETIGTTMSPNVFPPSGWFSRRLVTVTKILSQSLLHYFTLALFVIYVYCLSFKHLDTSLVHKSYHWAMIGLFKFKLLASLQTAVWEPQRSAVTLLLTAQEEGHGEGVSPPPLLLQAVLSQTAFSVTFCSLVIPVTMSQSSTALLLVAPSSFLSLRAIVEALYFLNSLRFVFLQ